MSWRPPLFTLVQEGAWEGVNWLCLTVCGYGIPKATLGAAPTRYYARSTLVFRAQSWDGYEWSYSLCHSLPRACVRRPSVGRAARVVKLEAEAFASWQAKHGAQGSAEARAKPEGKSQRLRS